MVKMTCNNTSCRICLHDGATCPIFDKTLEENSVISRITLCFKEKIEDEKGFPRYICVTCNNTLETVCKFINTFRETQQILENSLLSLKQENNNSDIEEDDPTEIKIDIHGIKTDPDIFLETVEDTDNLIVLLQPLEHAKKDEINRESFKVEKTDMPKAHKNKYKNRTDKVATSILEGEFAWTGETWCLKSTELKIPKDAVKGQRRDTRLRLPKKKTIKQSKLCDICGDTFKSQQKLTLHRKKMHFSNPRQCTQCLRFCSTEHNLNRHIKRKHLDKEFICSTCGSRFAFKGELKNHVDKVHSQKPKPIYSCKYCDKTYVTQKSVTIHERSAHTGERPAECSICFKGFFHDDYLKEHMRLHTGEAPFKCPVCDRGYAQRGNMKSHLRIHRISELDAETLSKIRPNYLKLLKD